MKSTLMRSPLAFVLALAGPVLVACGDDAGGTGGSGGTGSDAGSACGPDQTESPNGVCIENVPCGADIPTFKIGLVADGRDGNHSASIVDAMPSPPRQYFNAWTVDFLDADGQPADGIAIDKVRSWMPSHRHDGYITPITKAAGEPGRFSVSKINLWMPGPWEVQFSVTGSEASDYIVFRVCVTK